MPIKDKIISELSKGPVKYKKLRSKLKGGKKFYAAMEEMYSRGQIAERNGRISLVGAEGAKKDKRKPDNAKRAKARGETLQGRVVKLTENFGFVRVEGMDEDVFVPGRLMMGALTGDEVEISLSKGRNRDVEGCITAITKEKTNLVATIEKKNGRFYAQLKDCRYVQMPIMGKVGAQKGDVVIVNALGRGSSHRNLRCRVVQVIGKISSSRQAVTVLLARKGLETDYPQKAVKEAQAALENEIDTCGREDLTQRKIFTIDSASTKDIDDAIEVQKTDDGYILGVHIADVSRYVKKGSLCDREAFKRGNSVYFGNSVLPMLPTRYSNDLCSLNENVPRAAFSCQIQLDKQGNIKDYRFFKSVIKSRVKGVYSEINRILDSQAGPEIQDKYSRLTREIFTAYELYEVLDKNRKSRGSMNIESDEAYIIFDENGKAVDVKKRTRGKSEMMIEEFMLMANRCSANLAKTHKLPFVYRVHQSPDREKLELLKENLAKLGLEIQQKEGESLQQSLSRLLDRTKGTPLQKVVHKMVLRSQSKAKYGTQPIGHFGLSLEDYAHFTSPIRRYSDLAIHRVLTDYVGGLEQDKIVKKYSSFAESASTQTSATELVALQAERGADDIYKAEIMGDKIGEEFEGTISSVTNFGIYVALENTVEGMVRVGETGMVEPILEEGYRIFCPVSGIEYKIGDSVQVRVAGTDILNGNIDFDFPGALPAKKQDGKAKGRGSLKPDGKNRRSKDRGDRGGRSKKARYPRKKRRD